MNSAGRLTIVVAMAAFLAAAVLVVLHVQQGPQERRRICAVAQRDNDVLRRLIHIARKNAQVTLRSDPRRRAAANAFYREALGILKPVDCRTIK
jgi:hypothetical protein